MINAFPYLQTQKLERKKDSLNGFFRFEGNVGKHSQIFYEFVNAFLQFFEDFK